MNQIFIYMYFTQRKQHLFYCQERVVNIYTNMGEVYMVVNECNAT